MTEIYLIRGGAPAPAPPPVGIEAELDHALATIDRSTQIIADLIEQLAEQDQALGRLNALIDVSIMDTNDPAAWDAAHAACSAYHDFERGRR